MKLARWLLPLLSLAIVLLLTWRDLGGARTGPGPLHPAHARLAELEAGANCEACHLAGAGIDPNGCNRCHPAIGSQLAAATGLHGSLPTDRAKACGACHGEHHGAEVALIAPHAFSRAGVEDAAAYDHRHVAFGLTGVHGKLECSKCHRHGNDPEPPAGGRFLGLQQRCTSCHEDPHQAAYGADCASCHGQELPWRQAPKFPHDRFPLAAAHGKVACAKCHVDGSGHGVAELRQTSLPVRSCSECHETPHGGEGRPATGLPLVAAQDCARCHDATKWGNARPTPDQHAALGFALRGAHASASCASCHGDAPHEPRWRGQAPELAACAGCHTHPHGAELLAAATATQGPAAGCAGCHGDSDRDFRTGTMPAALHAATGFPLVVPHADLACAKCHQGEERTARFPGRDAADCRACHRDVHRGEFALESRYQQCTACHLATSFAPPQFGLAAHRRTAFPLTGAHDAVGCVACHKEVKDGVRKFRGTPAECSACHVDVHRGAFDRPGRPRVQDGKRGCVRCHDTSSFSPVVGAFDHALWTGYELIGAHTRVDCAACHPRAAGPATTATRRLGVVAGTRCADCHRDVHLGQFEVGGRTDCTRCHEAASFREVHIDHQQTRFPLDAVHRVVACAKCHREYGTGEDRVVRYKPLGLECGNCHQVGAPGGRK